MQTTQAQCEICGTEIKGRPTKVNIEGSELEVCSKCAQYGTSVDTKTQPKQQVSGKKTAPKKTEKKPYPTKSKFEGPTYELVEGYDQIIRDKREQLEWTQEELAAKIKEKESLIKKIERGEIVPEDSVRKKLERTLNLQLTEKVEDIDMDGDSASKNTTLGDIVKIKRE
ncbi:MAG: multiprotein bridging factor aMBF1 [Methanohalobium sp.]|uniref:multiprotein bridging factor aMBF1 n=1 Tax=Methanohalobium sp. TaxID=2837493 RepID=UPI00397836C3